MKKEQNTYKKAKNIFIKNGGVLRTGKAIDAGIHPRTLYEMRDDGIIEKLSRGLYRLTDLPPLDNPDLVSVSMKIPEGVICLISALSFHGITTQIPHEIYIAIARNAEPPRVDYPPLRIFRFSEKTFSEGIEAPVVDNVSLRVYSPEKTLADCFKYRNKIGIDIAIEALKLYCKEKHIKVNDLMHFAKVCRVDKIMRPYLEALL